MLEKRLDITRPKSGRRLYLHEYQNSRRIAFLEGPRIGLFCRYDPVTSRHEATWERCQFAMARKVKIECHHKEGCTGFADRKPNALMGRFLRTCDCPDQTVLNSYVWLVDPKDATPEFIDEEGEKHVVTHGKELT